MTGRRFHGLLFLAAVLGCLLGRVGAQTQTIRSSKFRLTRRDPRRQGSHISLPVLAGESQLLATASPDVLWVQCPAEAIGLDPAVTCGYLPVPMHREKTEKIRIYFEVYPHTNAGQAESAILVNGGGPGLTTTGFRTSWLLMFLPNMDVHDLLLVDDRGRGFSGAIDCEPGQHGLGPTWDDEVADCAAWLQNIRGSTTNKNEGGQHEIRHIDVDRRYDVICRMGRSASRARSTGTERKPTSVLRD